MLEIVSARSRVLRWIFPAVLLPFCCAVRPTVAQTQTPASTQTPAGTVPSNGDSTRREIQPNLSVDRDPVPSPDAADNGTVTPSTAITAAKGQGSNVYTLHENVDEVLLPCTVVDQNGTLVTDLTQGDFHVWEDNVPQNITSFQHRDVPISLGILVDNSGSMRDKRDAVDSAALHLVRESNPADTAFVVNFNDKAFLDQGFTSNISYLEAGLSHYDTRGTTAIYDAVVASADELSRHGKSGKPVLLVITDGEDNASRLTLEQAVRRVQQLNGPVVYTIGLLYDSESKQEAQRARDALQTLADQTGGFAYFPQSLREVDWVATEVAHVIRNQYIVGYHSAKSPDVGGYRRVHVAAAEPKRGQLVVKTRNGYYPREIKQMHSDGQTAQEITTQAQDHP
jgi:Ca-activated chloride channel family protein